MKRLLVLFLAVTLLLTSVACGKIEADPIHMEPQVSQMKAICELATMKCYYHNVAKFFKEDAEKGFLGIGSKDMRFWIEYSGVVTLGIDASLMSIEVSDTQITITLPEAKVLNCEVDEASLSKDSYIVDKNSAEPTAEDEIEAFNQAQAEMRANAENDAALLASAQQRAQTLLEEYVHNIGEVVGKQYSIKWVYVDAEGNQIGTYIQEAEPPTE